MWKNYIESIGIFDSDLIHCFPDFLGISPPKTGSTWLFDNFKKHPGIYLNDTKELRFFCTNWKNAELNWYLRHFQRDNGLIKGEICPTYSILPRRAIQLISQIKPDLKLIFLMRDPIERVWSHTKHLWRYGEGNFKNIGISIENITTDMWIENFMHNEFYPYEAYNDYLKCLHRWLEFFPKEQIYVGFFEEIKNNPQGLISSILGFIGTEVGINIDELSQKSNEGNKLKISEELTKVLRTLHKKPTLELVNFLKSGFGLDAPLEWRNTLIGEEIEEPIIAEQNYCGWDIIFWKNDFYAASKEIMNQYQYGDKLFLDAAEKHNLHSRYLFEAKFYIDIELADKKLGNNSPKFTDIEDGLSFSKHCLSEMALETNFLLKNLLEFPSYYGYNIVGFSGKLYAIPQVLGAWDLTDEKKRNHTEVLSGQTVFELENLIDKRKLRQTEAELERLYAGYPDPILVEDFGKYNIVAWQGKYYGLPKELGAVDIMADDLSTLKGVFIDISIERLKQLIKNHLDLIAEIERSHGEIERSHAQIQEMESSKFWKLRSAWLRLKETIKLTKK